MLKGKKTYLVAVASILYAGLGLYSGHVTFDQAVNIVQTAAIGAGLRDALKNVLGA